MEAGVVVDAGGRADLVTAVGSMAGLVHELAGVVAFPPAAPDGPTGVPDADADPLQESSAACLDGLGVVARLEAATAALKVRLVAAYAESADAREGPPASAHEATAREVSKVTEVACALTIGERAASALLGETHALTTSLPAALDALQAGTASWLHARIVVEETAGLTPAAASALEAHFFGPDAANLDGNPGRAAAPGALVKRLLLGKDWTPTEATKNQPPGWISPAGRHYPAEHPDREPPLIPPDCLPGKVGLLEQAISPLEQAILARLAA